MPIYSISASSLRTEQDFVIGCLCGSLLHYFDSISVIYIHKTAKKAQYTVRFAPKSLTNIALAHRKRLSSVWYFDLGREGNEAELEGV